MKILLILIVLVSFVHAEQLPSIKSLSSLTNPKKLAALKSGNRSGNVRFRKLMFWINQYENKGVKPKDFLVSLYAEHGDIKPYSNKNHVYAPIAEKSNLEAQYRLGKLHGLYTEANLLLLRKGRSAIITKGKYIGDKIEVDHLIPFKVAPELENSLANLTWLPSKLNRSKRAKMTNAAFRRIRSLNQETGWILAVTK